MWGRKYPSVSPLLCPHCTDHYYSLTHTWPSGGWGLLLVITLAWWLTVFTLHGQMSALFTIFTSPSPTTLPCSNVWSIFWNVTTKRQRNNVDRDNWFENIALGNFLAMIMACMIIYFFPESRFLGIITSIYPESGLWSVGTLWQERGSGIQGNDVMGAAIITRDIPSLRAASNGEINCITNWPQFRFIIGHICIEPQWMIITWTIARAGPMSCNSNKCTTDNVECIMWKLHNDKSWWRLIYSQLGSCIFCRWISGHDISSHARCRNLRHSHHPSFITILAM